MLHTQKERKTDTLEVENAITQIPRYKMAPGSLSPRQAYHLVRDELIDEGNARQNLATFCQTFMEEEAVRLISETLKKNSIDKSEYPRTAELENRCVQILADLWNVPAGAEFIGTSTVGSSEACMLSALAMKFRWRKRMKTSQKPNLVISSGFQVCWEKFCRYWDVELRAIPMDASHFCLDAEKAILACDEGTIGVVGILGITYTGMYDDIRALDKVVETYNQHATNPISIHIDAASGGLYAPFVQPELVWDFRLKNVVSINTSGHKYGLVYPGIGWVLWKEKEFLPEELIFQVSYLGGTVPTMAINFSRSAGQIIGQYYNFVRFGRSGYERIHRNTQRIAQYLASEVEKMGYFQLYHHADHLPLICYGFGEDVDVSWNLYDLSDHLRMRGWQVPTYPLPENLQEILIHRYVCRADLTLPMAEHLLDDLQASIRELNDRPNLTRNEYRVPQGFTH